MRKDKAGLLPFRGQAYPIAAPLRQGERLANSKKERPGAMAGPKSGRFSEKLVEAGRARDVPGHALVGDVGRNAAWRRGLRGLRRRRLRQHDHLGADLHAAIAVSYTHLR